VFSGITTFARLDYVPCLATDEVKYDIAFIGTTDPRLGRF
jgi:agmatinase